MTITDLMDSLATKYSMVGIYQETGRENIGGKTIIHYSVPVMDIFGDIIIRQWIHFYYDGTNAFWQDKEPKFIPPHVDSFIDRVNNFISSKITDGTIKFGYILQLNETTGKALVSVIKIDKTTTTGIVTETSPDVFTIEII